nr:MAG TPA: hypothetical protein [Caudoviricetes sp.]
MTQQIVTFDDETIAAGKFYAIFVNKDNAPLLLEIDHIIGLKHEFSNTRYLEFETNISNPSIQAYEKISDNVFKKIECDIKVKNLESTRIIIAEFNKPMTGYVIIK